MYSGLDGAGIFVVLHLLDYLRPFGLRNNSADFLFDQSLNFFFGLVRIPTFDEYLDQIVDSISDLLLDEPEFFVALVLQHLSEERHVGVVSRLLLDRVENGRVPLDDQTLQALLFVEEVQQMLLHRLSRHFQLGTLHVLQRLALLHLLYGVLKLLQRQIPDLQLARRTDHVLVILLDYFS